MILKERDDRMEDTSDRFSKAGAEAEERLAFYLRRVFGDRDDVLILHDIRLQIDDGDNVDTAQIDHFVIHRHGLIIVESKSCCGEIRVNKQGQWSRTWERRETGFQSPVFQAQLQADLLRKALNAFADELLNKMLLGKVQKSFRNCPIEIIVAVSDKGVIKDKCEVPELLKADQVPGKINEILERHRKAASVFNMKLDLKSNDGLMVLSSEERQRIAEFLIQHHYPLEARKKPVPRTVSTPSTRPPVSPPATTPAEPNSRLCPRCGKPMVVRSGKKGDNAGKKFWGCTGYAAKPQCRETIPID